MNRISRVSVLTVFAGLAVACGQTVERAPESEPALATPSASEPAAGLCAEASGTEAFIRLEPGIPDPRCLIITPAQTLRVANHTGAAVTVTLGREQHPIPPEGEVVFSTPLGEALLPGVHALLVDPCCGGELWLKP